MSIKFRKSRIGFVNLLSPKSWNNPAQKDGLIQSDKAKEYLRDLNVQIFSNPSSVADLVEAKQSWKYFKENNVDAVVLFNGNFSLGNLTIEIVRNLDLPFLLWGIEETQINKGILSGSMIGLMPAGTTFRNLNKKFIFSYGTIEKEDARNRVKRFINAVRAMAYMNEAKIALIGSRPDGFEISGFDELAIKRVFGTTINKISMDYLLKAIDGVDKNAIDLDMKKQKKIFDINNQDVKEVKELSRIYIAIKKIVKKYNVQAIAPQCWPELRINRKTPMCTANGRITAEGVVVSCEADIDSALTMLLLHALNGGTPWTADFANIIEEKDSLLFWHCGNASYNLSDQKPIIEYVSEGLAQTASLKPGIATVCRINHYKDGFEIFAGLGEVIKSRPIIKGSNMFIRMNRGNMNFVESMLENGIPHHNVIVYGDVTEELKIFAKLKDLPAKIIK